LQVNRQRRRQVYERGHRLQHNRPVQANRQRRPVHDAMTGVIHGRLAGADVEGAMTTNVVRGMPADQYLATKALSASGAWLLSESCPAHFWHASPWNPDREADNERHFDIGKALHLAVLQPDDLARAIVIIDADNYRTKAAQTLRDEAYEAGKTPLLAQELDVVIAMDRAIHADPYAAELLGDGDPADNEVSFFWEDQHGTPCKARADRISRKHRAILDLKTAACAAPRAWQAAAFRDGHPLRAPFYLDGWEMASGECLRRYAFIVVEKEPPHVVQIYDLDERAMEWGRLMMRRALHLFVQHSVSGWNVGYSTGPLTIGLPSWAEYALADREASGDFRSDRPSAAALARVGELLSP
jgi:hypothetical protein